jgi:hypothetical protein
MVADGKITAWRFLFGLQTTICVLPKFYSVCLADWPSATNIDKKISTTLKAENYENESL